MGHNPLAARPAERVQASKAHLPSLMSLARETGSRGADDKRRVVEEPDEGKPSRPVLKPSQERRPSWLRQQPDGSTQPAKETHAGQVGLD